MVFIVTGKQGEGKTTLIRNVVSQLILNGILVSGFYAEGSWLNDVRDQFTITDFRSNDTKVLCVSENRDFWLKYGRFFFDPIIIEWGELFLDPAFNKASQLYVIDEIGKFELEGKVWNHAFKLLLRKNKNILISVRDRLVDNVVQHFSLHSYFIFHVSEPVDDISTKIQEMLK
ncbi:MAG: hypothetical protein JXR65_08805 [Bacteroidales bacterium]|nr:hypothetical protein [Bacteroidales bacterium]